MGARFKPAGPTVAQSESLGASALLFLAQDRARLAHFLSLTGMEPGVLMQSAGSHQTLSAVLEHLLGDESLLLTFAAGAGIRPEDVGRALSSLSGGVRKEGGG
jgi:hypothetical protein